MFFFYFFFFLFMVSYCLCMFPCCFFSMSLYSFGQSVNLSIQTWCKWIHCPFSALLWQVFYEEFNYWNIHSKSKGCPLILCYSLKLFLKAKTIRYIHWSLSLLQLYHHSQSFLEVICAPDYKLYLINILISLFVLFST